jgi:hypothetical protein
MRHNHDIGQQQPPKSTSKDAATYFSIAETRRCLTDTPVSLAEVAGQKMVTSNLHPRNLGKHKSS